MAAYYNEIDPFAAQWLKKLIGARLIADGEVDERSIIDVEPADLRPFRQCHFFAGIGGWAHALALAGWPEDRPVWTGSVPCQPLSSAGQRRGHLDRRHLWPAFYRLIAECRPPTLLGEQVASRLGREWFAGIRVDLEHLGFAVGGADLPAACVGAPHIRQRLYWVALSGSAGSRDIARPAGDERRLTVDAWSASLRPGNGETLRDGTGAASGNGRLADAGGDRRDDQPRSAGSEAGARLGRGEPDDGGRLGDTCGDGRSRRRQPQHAGEQGTFWLLFERPGAGGFRDGTAGGGGLGLAEKPGQQGRLLPASGPARSGAQGTEQRSERVSATGGLGDASEPRRLPLPERQELPRAQRHDAWRAAAEPSHAPGAADRRLADAERDDRGADLAERRAPGRIADFWADAVWLQCLDGKARRVESSIQPLATGISNRVGLLRGSGNSIVPQAAAVFITAVMEAT